jgi:hypothetical protein
MEIGSDLQYTEGRGFKWKGMPKVIRFEPHPNTYSHCPYIIGFAGLAEAIVAVAEFLTNPDTIKPPKIKDLRGAILTEEGKLFCFDSYDKWLPVHDPFYAIGSGAPIALGVLHGGGTVKEAIKIASKVDPYTGMGIKVLKF